MHVPSGLRPGGSHLCVMPVTVHVLSFSRGAWHWGLPLEQIRAACPEQEEGQGSWSSSSSRVLLCPSCADRERRTGAAGEFWNCFSAVALPCLDPMLCHFSAVPLQLGLEWLPVSRSFWNIGLYRFTVKGKASSTGLRLRRPSTTTESLPWLRD